jgi:hypothetical protein
MIEKNTVLVLGAGASMPYSFPSGESLIREIINSKSVYNQLIDLFSIRLISEFRNALLNSGRYSIDTFLEYRPKFQEIGKVAIASVLIPKEEESKKAFVDFNNEDNWYRYFYNALNSSIDNFKNNKIAIITFNYDRSLEYYLFNALKNSHEHMNDNRCALELYNIPILHVHGKLDHLPWEYLDDGKKREYGEQQTPPELKESSKGIRIIHESTKNDTLFQEAYELINKADNLYFIGFGFHKDNLDRLQIDKLVNEGKLKEKRINGSSYKLGNAKKRSVNDYFNLNIEFLSNRPNLKFLKDKVPFE